MCERCLAGEDGFDQVMVTLVMPSDRAVALMAEFRDKKLAGQPASIDINVMHIAVIATTGDVPEPVDGQGARLHQGAVRPRRHGIWWPKALALLVWLAGCGTFMVTLASRTGLAVVVGAVTVALSFQLGRRIRWRR